MFLREAKPARRIRKNKLPMTAATVIVDKQSTETVTIPQETRVAWIAPSLDRGWRWQPFLKEFSEIYPNTVVFTGLWPGFTHGFEGAFKIHRLRGFRRVNLSDSNMGYPKGFMWASPLTLWDLLRFRPEIILTNGFHLCTLYALLVKLILRSRLILLWQGVSPETGGSRGSLRLKLRQLVGRCFDLAICNTRSGISYLQDLVGMPPKKVLRFVGEVADRKPFASRDGNGASLRHLTHPTFLFVGRVIRAKGVDRLLDACSLLVQRGVNNFSVVLVGKGPHQDEFAELARRIGIEDKVHWEGFVPYENLGAYYEACDVFVLPSREDTWGVVALEAMAFGKPVLCSSLAGSSELVQHGVTGYVFDPDTPDELANYMMQFIHRPQLISRCGAAAQKSMAQYTPKIAASKLSRILYKTLHAETPTADYEQVWRDS